MELEWAGCWKCAVFSGVTGQGRVEVVGRDVWDGAGILSAYWYSCFLQLQFEWMQCWSCADFAGVAGRGRVGVVGMDM